MSLFLSYDAKRGLVKEANRAYGNYVQEHDERGGNAPLHEQTLEIPERNVKIVIKTKLHAGAASYMNATISMMDKPVLNFIDTSLRHAIWIVYAKPADWNTLFDGIIKLYNSIFNGEKPINDYFDAIERVINNPTDDQYFERLVDVVRRLGEISDRLAGSIYGDNEIVHRRLKQACRVLVQSLNKSMQNQKFSTSISLVEPYLHMVFKYLAGRDAIFYVLTGRNPMVGG